MITGGFGTMLDLQTGTSRRWFMRRDGVKRWDDTNAAIDCKYCNGSGEIETDNNGPIGPCPVCMPNTVSPAKVPVTG